MILNLSGRFKMMFHVHKEDDIMILIQLVREFGIRAIAIVRAVVMSIERKSLQH